MILGVYIGTVALSSVLSFINYKKNKRETDKVELVIYNIFSVIPVVNLLVVGNFAYNSVNDYKYKKLKDKEAEDYLNELYKCNNCDIYVRKVYIEDYASTINNDYVINTCPVCKERCGFEYIKKSVADKLVLSEKIPEQQYMTLKEYNERNKTLELEKKKEQDALELENQQKLLELKKKEAEPEYVKQESKYEEIRKKNLFK